MGIPPHPGELQIEEAGNSGLGFGDALRWGGSEGRQLDTCILRVSFFLLAGNMTHVRQVSDGHVRITELVLEKNEPPPKKKKIGKTVNLRRHWEGTQWNCRVVSSVRVWVYISLWRGGGREWFYFLPGGCADSPETPATRGVFSWEVRTHPMLGTLQGSARSSPPGWVQLTRWIILVLDAETLSWKDSSSSDGYRCTFLGEVPQPRRKDISSDWSIRETTFKAVLVRHCKGVDTT